MCLGVLESQSGVDANCTVIAQGGLEHHPQITHSNISAGNCIKIPTNWHKTI